MVKNLALGGNIVFHRAEVVEVVFRDVANARRPRIEMHIALQLQPRGLRDDDVALARFQRVLRNRHADVAEHECMPSAGFEDLACQRGAGGLAVGARDADKLRMAVAVAKLDLADDLDALFLRRAHKRNRHRDNRADDDERNALKQRLRLFAQPPLNRNAAERFA